MPIERARIKAEWEPEQKQLHSDSKVNSIC